MKIFALLFLLGVASASLHQNGPTQQRVVEKSPAVEQRQEDHPILKREVGKIEDDMLDEILDELQKLQQMSVDAISMEHSGRESRGIKDYWEKIKDYFKDLKIDLQEKYMKFGEWVKNVYEKGMEHSKDKMSNIKAIAKEFAKHAKNVSKEVGAEASEFFRQYKDELGVVWEELQEVFKQIKNREN